MNDLSIIITSFNRPTFLLRNIKYLLSFEGNFKIIIADSSEEGIISSELQKFVAQKNILLKKFDTDIKVAQKIYETLRFVKTKYSVIVAEDDFIYPPSIEKCKNFLDKNHDYVSCHGKYYIHSPYNISKKYGVAFRDQSLTVQSCEFEDVLDRIQFYLDGKMASQYTFYAVFETKNLLETWQQTYMYANEWLINEYFPCIISLILGKMKTLPIFYMSREPNLHNWVDDNRINLIFTRENNNIYSNGIVENIKKKQIINDDILLKQKYFKIFNQRREDLLKNKSNKTINQNNIFKTLFRPFYYLYLRKKFEFNNKEDLNKIEIIKDFIIETGEVRNELMDSRKKY